MEKTLMEYCGDMLLRAFLAVRPTVDEAKYGCDAVSELGRRELGRRLEDALSDESTKFMSERRHPDFAVMESEIEAAKARLRKALADGQRAYWEASPEEQMRARLEFWTRLVPAGKPSLKWGKL